MVTSISLFELKKLIESKSDFNLIDVREKNEMFHGMIPTAKNIPMSEIESAFTLNESDFNKKYGFSNSKIKLNVVYCRTGGRSTRVAEFLEKKGFIVKNFKGSVQEWSLHDKNVKMY